MAPEFLLQLKDWISQPWPWWVAGPMIALVMFILMGSGYTVFVVFLLAAMTGTFAYGKFRSKLPH